MNQYMQNVHRTCAQNGNCQFNTAQLMCDKADQLTRQATQIIEMSGKMSQALWCDQGGHAFSERDPDKEHYSRTTYDRDGNPMAEIIDVCGKHAIKFEVPGETARKSQRVITKREHGDHYGRDDDDF